MPNVKKKVLIYGSSDLLLVAALVALPVDGTRFGVAMPYWTPIAPVFFVLYALCNPRLLLRSARKYFGFFLFLPALVCVSMFGWMTVGFQKLYVFQTVFSLTPRVPAISAVFQHYTPLRSTLGYSGQNGVIPPFSLRSPPRPARSSPLNRPWRRPARWRRPRRPDGPATGRRRRPA